MTQDELAEKLCAKKSRISNYENGYSTPDIYTLCKLADIFDITLDDLVEWEHENGRSATPDTSLFFPNEYLIGIGMLIPVTKKTRRQDVLPTGVSIEL